MSTPHPNLWADYYDKGYERELELLDDVLKEAGGNAYRALTLYSDKLGRYERMFEIGERDGQAVIDRCELKERRPRTKVADSPTGLPVFTQAWIVGEFTRVSSYLNLGC